MLILLHFCSTCHVFLFLLARNAAAWVDVYPQPRSTASRVFCPPILSVASCGRSDHGPTDNSALAGLLCLESLEFEVLPLNLGVLRRHPPLQIIFLLLTCLHLITDQSTADQSNCRADAGTGAGISCRAADNRTQTGARESSDRRAFFSRR